MATEVLGQFGSLTVPRQVWRTLQRLGSWVEPVLVNEWARLVRAYGERMGRVISLGEVEAALGTCEGVADVVVVGVPDPDWGEAVTAFVIPSDPAMPPGLDELKAGVRAVLPAYAAPRRMWLVSQFPQLASGKPDRVALRQVGGNRAARDGVS